MSMAKVSTYRVPDAIIEQKAGHLENGGHDSLDNFIIQAIGKEPFLSFSQPGESPVQWVQLLHALDQEGSGYRDSQIDNTVEENDHQQENYNVLSSLAPGTKEPGNFKGNGLPARVTKSSSEHMQTLKIPEAVIAFAQAAAKANGKREKYLPGWPLLSPSKVQLQKCGKCSREFCSPINYRRHIRVHHRSLNIVKVSPKNRELLGAFWDKLSLDAAMELASIKDMTLEGVSGSSILRSLTSLMRRPGFSSFPQVYLKAGATLLEVVECRPSVFPISSQELFSVLDDASEKTFLCAGTAISLQRFVFDREVGKIAMEMKNVIACTSFLLEQKLVEAWLANKDAEALRCQQLLFEEEEAAQKRQAELLERKRMKKLRQKEQKMKEHVISKSGSEGSSDAVEGTSCSEETLSLTVPPEAGITIADSSLFSSNSVLEDTKSSLVVADGTCYQEAKDACQCLEQQFQPESAQGQPILLLHRPVLNPTRNGLGGFHSKIAVTKPMAGQKHNGYKDLKPNSLANSQKVWTRKSKSDCEVEDANCKKSEKETRGSSDRIESCNVLIGSISVTLNDGHDLHENDVSVGYNGLQKELVNIDCTMTSVNRAPVKLCSCVDRREDGVPGTVKSDTGEADINESASRSLPAQSCLADCGMGDCKSEMTRDSPAPPEFAEPSAPKLFSTKVAVAFLSQRWREALSSDHVKLVLSPDTEGRSMDDADIHKELSTDVSDGDICEESFTTLPAQPIDCSGLSNPGNLENPETGIGSVQPISTSVYKPMFRAKPEKSYRPKYVPRQSLSG